MPAGTSRNLYSAYQAFTKMLDTHSAKMLSIIHRVIKKQQVKGNIQVETEIKAAPTPPTVTSGSWYDKQKNLMASYGPTVEVITKPQINFKVQVDNEAMTPLKPRLKYKPHALKPLAILAEYTDDGSIKNYLHPYEFELSKWKPSGGQLEVGKVCVPPKLNETPLEFVDTEAKLKALLNDLNSVTEIAVDIEHHSYRTFQGITCLLQLSTRQKDYIIDTLALRDELHALNEAFANPKMLKVFHAAELDVGWLQRDLSIYVVNMFDTLQAAKRLGLARLSLAFLLKHYCNIDADKSLKLADWRIRPLPDELITYARQDTHYLLYIHDLQRQESLKKANGQTNLLLDVYYASTYICMRRYVKVKMIPKSHMTLYHKSKRIFDNRQLYAFKELFAWRDSIARSEDESYEYVLPDRMMLEIAENLPLEMEGILACCEPIPPLVRQHLYILHRFILEACEQPFKQSAVKIVNDEQLTNRLAIQSRVQNLKFSHLYYPHDIPVNIESHDDLPILLDQNGTNDSTESDSQLNGKMKLPSISAFLVTKKARKSSLPEELCPEKHVTIAAPATILREIRSYMYRENILSRIYSRIFGRISRHKVSYKQKWRM